MASRVADQENGAGSTETDIVRGTVKWFDRKRGFGFIVPDDGSADVLLHCTIIAEHGRRDLPDGTSVTCRFDSGPRGRNVTQLLEFYVPPDAMETPEQPPRNRPVETTPPPEDYTLCTVKWFSRVKGFGFVQAEGLDQDVFLHMEILRQARLGPVMTDDKIFARIVDSGRGPTIDAVHDCIIAHEPQE